MQSPNACAPWATRFWRPVKDDELLPWIVAGLHLIAFPMLALGRMVMLLGQDAAGAQGLIPVKIYSFELKK